MISKNDKFMSKYILKVLILFYTIIFQCTIVSAEISLDSLIPVVTSPSVAVIDAKTGVVIFDKNKDDNYFPASITKIMTALLTIEYAESSSGYDERITFSRNAVYSIPSSSSNIAMQEGETITLKDALYALMLASANEVAVALAEHIGGTIENFSVMMNEKARQVGASNTNFANPHGLHDENHYTTAYDIAVIMREAARHQVFRDIISTYSYTIPPTEKLMQERIFHNTNKMIQPGQYHHETIIGGKTGFTDQAKNTLVTLAGNDEAEIIVAVMYDDKYETYMDTKTLIDYGFEQFEYAKVLSRDSYETKIKIGKDSPFGFTLYGEARVWTDSDIYSLIPINYDKNALVLVPDIYEQTREYISEGTNVGKLTVYYDGAKLGEAALVSKDAIDEFLYLSTIETERKNSGLNNTTEFPENDSHPVFSEIEIPPGTSSLLTFVGFLPTEIIIVFSAVVLILAFAFLGRVLTFKHRSTKFMTHYEAKKYDLRALNRKSRGRRY